MRGYLVGYAWWGVWFQFFLLSERGQFGGQPACPACRCAWSMGPLHRLGEWAQRGDERNAGCLARRVVGCPCAAADLRTPTASHPSPPSHCSLRGPERLHRQPQRQPPAHLPHAHGAAPHGRSKRTAWLARRAAAVLSGPAGGDGSVALHAQGLHATPDCPHMPRIPLAGLLPRPPTPRVPAAPLACCPLPQVTVVIMQVANEARVNLDSNPLAQGCAGCVVIFLFLGCLSWGPGLGRGARGGTPPATAGAPPTGHGPGPLGARSGGTCTAGQGRAPVPARSPAVSPAARPTRRRPHHCPLCSATPRPPASQRGRGD